jgi:hypothetical protein
MITPDDNEGKNVTGEDGRFEIGGNDFEGEPSIGSE